jgi:hypothetical protein
VRAVILQDITILLNGDSTIKHSGLDFRKVLGKTLVLVSNLERKLTGMTENKNGNLVFAFWEGRRIKLVKSCKNKDSSLSHTRLGLTNNVHTKDGLRNAFVLDLGRMFKSAINNSTKTFGLQDKIFETRGMNTDVVTPVPNKVMEE